MKKLLLLLLLPLVLLIGCGKKGTTVKIEEPVAETKPVEEDITTSKPESDGVNAEELEEREGINYLKGSDTPYTGKSFRLYESGQKWVEHNLKDGKFHRLEVYWHKNGQKYSERNFNDGEKIEGSEKWWTSNGELVDTREEAFK